MSDPQNVLENRSAREPLVLCAITGRNTQHKEITVSVFADMVKVSQCLPPKPADNDAADENHRPSNSSSAASETVHQLSLQHPEMAMPDGSYEAKRGLITRFSRKSRRRMIDKFAQKRNTERLLFMTPTYPDEIWFVKNLTMRDFQDHLNALFKRMQRKWPNVGIVWRKEIEVRKSGRYKGWVAPHGHLVVDGITDELGGEFGVRKWLRENWTEIIGATNLEKRVRVDVQVAKNRRHIYWYVSKYVSKPTPEAEKEISEYFHNHAGDFGRHWGVVGCWDITPSIVIQLTHQEFVEFKRSVSAWLKSRARNQKQRFWARRLKQSPADVGFSTYGLGDDSVANHLLRYDCTVFRMLFESG